MRHVTWIALGLFLIPAATFAQAPPLPPPVPVAPTPPLPPPMPADMPLLPMAPVPTPSPFDMHVEFGHLDAVRESLDAARMEMDIEMQMELESRQIEARAAQRAAAFMQDAQVVLPSRNGGRANGYNGGLEALQRRNYDEAVTDFDAVISAKGDRADAAHYWKAFAQFRLGQTSAALATLDALRRGFPQSRYLSDARVLEADLKQQSGQPVDPAGIDDDEIKLLAIQGLRQSEQVVPLLQQVLAATNSLNVKRRALYVLALNEDARARQVLLDYARGAGTPDLQVDAIRYLTSRRDLAAASPLLREVYAGTTEASLKREVINAYITLGRVRSRAVETGGMPGAVRLTTTSASADSSSTAVATELVALYRQETDPDMKRHIIGALSAVGAIDQLMPLIRGEKDPAVQREVIGVIGGRRSAETTRALVGLYGDMTDLAAKEAVIATLAGQRDADALVALARQETNTRLKTTLVRHISGLAKQSDVAAAYLAEVLQ